MSTILIIFSSALYIAISIMMCVQESKRKPLNFWLAIILSILFTPILTYLVFRLLPDKNPKGCNFCGNKYNEAEYCGLCGRNTSGDYHPNWHKEKTIDVFNN